MKLQKLLLGVGLISCASVALAGDKVEAVVGGAAGGAVGAIIGDELGDRKGAIIGAGVGAAVGTAIATDGNDKPKHHDAHDGHVPVEAGGYHRYRHGYHCPPGLAKQGRC